MAKRKRRRSRETGTWILIAAALLVAIGLLSMMG